MSDTLTLHIPYEDQVLSFQASLTSQHITFVALANLVPLLRAAELTPNPRRPKMTKVTKEIIATLETAPQRYAHLTKGIMFACTSAEKMEDNTLKITLSADEAMPSGILDGGHNAFALIANLTKSKPKSWAQAKHALANTPDADLHIDPNIVVPVRFLLPSDPTSDYMSEYQLVSRAHNTTAAVKDGALDALYGHLDIFQQALPQELRERIQWRQNSSGDLKIGDVTKLLLVPLSALPESQRGSIDPTDMYVRSKKVYDRLLDTLTSLEDPNPMIDKDTFKSVLGLIGETAALFDHIQTQIPLLYNATSGKWGARNDNKDADEKVSKKVKFTYFFNEKMPHTYKVDTGFVYPLLWALTPLLEVSPEGAVRFKTDPKTFFDTHAPKLFGDMVKAKIKDEPVGVFGKKRDNYDLFAGAFETCLLRDMLSASQN